MLGVGGLVAVLGPAVLAASPASAAVPFSSADFSGYANSAYAHVGAVTLGNLQVAKADVVPANALVNSKGLGPVSNTYGLPVNRTNTGGVSTAKANANAAAVSAGLLAPPTTGGDINLTGLVSADAPPPSSQAKDIALNLPGLVQASLLHSVAAANYVNDQDCFLGGNISAGEADATGLALLNTVLSTPASGTARFLGATRFVPQTNAANTVVGSDLGLASYAEADVPAQALGVGALATINIHALRFALQTVATGIPGAAYVTYGPVAGVSGDPVVASVELPTGNPVLNITLSQIVGPNGLDTHDILGGALDSIIRLKIGGQPTTSVAPDGTAAAASTDIIRVSALQGSVADLRVGHMEAAARVPAGGVSCSLHPTKTANPNPVTVGNNFVYTIGVPNPNACTLTNVMVTDIITASTSIKFSVVQTQPQASSISSLVTDPDISGHHKITVVFNDIGPIPPGQTGTAQILVAIDGSSGLGTMTDKVSVTGTCAIGSGSGTNTVNVGLAGQLVVTAPQVAAAGALARTGDTFGIRAWLAGLGLLSFVAAERIRRRIRTSD